MATIASLVVKVSFDAAKLKRSLSSATKRIKAFATSAIKTLKRISIGIGVGITAGVVAIISIVNKYSAQIDKMAKTSSKLGLSVKVLQKLQYQAELTGVSTDTMNMALQRMVRRVSEAAKGTGAAKDALKELGLSAEALNNLSPDQQFYAISEAMKQIGNQGDKVRLAMKIFDTEGVSLVNTMNGNLKQMGEEFDSLGFSVTRLGARMVESYQDSKTKLSAIFSGFGLQLTAQLAAPFKILIDWITKLAIGMGGMDKLANKFAIAFINGIELMIRAGAGFIKLINRFEVGILRVKRAFLELEKLNTWGFQEEELNRIQLELYGIDSQIKALTDKNNVIDITINNDIKNKIDELRAGLAGNDSQSAIKGSTQKQEGMLINSAHSKALNRAANDAIIMAESTKIAADSVDNFANSMISATKSINPYIASDKPGAYSFSSSLSSAKGLSPGLSALSASKSATSAINATPSLGEFNINMQTDAGKISGKLFGEPSFISNLKSFSDKQTNESARMATQ